MLNFARPFIKLESVADALDAMRQARPLGSKHPLTNFLSLRGFTVEHGENAATDAAIFATLSATIRRRVSHYRQRHGLGFAPDDSGMLRADFTVGSRELEAWSILYYRYVRVDLDLSVEQIKRMANQSLRTLSRRQHAGLVRLAHTLARREMRVRKQHKKAWLRANLPRARPVELLGREALLDQAFAYLSGAPRHVLLHGPPGIGKSVLALALAHRAIEAFDIQNLAWLDHVDPDPSCLLETVVLRLGVAGTELSVYLQMVDTLVVLDHMNGIARQPDFGRVLAVLAPARLIICAHDWLPDLQDLARIAIEPLDHEAALALLEREAQKRRIEDDDLLNRMYHDLGGNPAALLRAIRAGRRYRPAQISAQLYQSFWEAASDAERLAWLVTMLTGQPYTPNNGPESKETVARLAMPSETNQLAQAFARFVVGSENSRGLVRAAFQRAAELLSGRSRNILDYLHLLEMARLAALPGPLLLNIAYEFAPVVERSGAWNAWALYLELVYDVLKSASKSDPHHRLWVRLRLGTALRWLARADEAEYHLSETVAEAGATGRFDIQAEAMLELAILYQNQANYRTAETFLQRAINYFKRMGLGLERAIALCVQGALEYDDLERAELYIREAIGPSGDYDGLPPQLAALAAQVALRRGAIDDALKYADAAWRGLEGDTPRLVRLASLLGQIYYERRDVTSAVNYMTLAIEGMAKNGDLRGYARARLNLGLMYIGWGKLRTAANILRKLPAEFERLGDINSLRIAAQNLENISRSLK